MDELKEYGTLKAEAEDLEYRRKRSYSVADTVRGSSTESPYTVHTIGIAGMESSSLSYLYTEEIIKLRQKLESVETYIASIDNSLIRQIFRYKYIDCLNWDDIADKLHYCNRHVQRIHDKYVKNNMS